MGNSVSRFDSSIFCLMGPTASGKTQLAIELARQFPFEVISVDSAMVYRGMDIGTAKPSADILREIPHHLIDIRDPSEPYSAAQFCHDANLSIKDIFSRGKIPLLVGGTMLYARALQQGLSLLPVADPLLRARLKEEGDQKGWDKLHQRLSDVDPIAAARIHPNDPQRIQRALEVYELTGKNLTTWHQENPASSMFDSIYSLAIIPSDRALLHARIAERFSEMLKAGWIDEVRCLFERGDLTPDLPSIRSVGYRQIWDYLAGKISYLEMEERGVIATRQLAKRQLTWLKSWPDLVVFESEANDLFVQVFQWLKTKLG